MGDHYPTVKVAVVQAAPIFLDREATTDRACRLIREAGQAPSIYLREEWYGQQDKSKPSFRGRGLL